ncbi:MAG: ABC transporter permease [Ardenticatenaceae bacterium]|nr:ABC transporter permease [Ardenticatenaceae bacterium]
MKSLQKMILIEFKLFLRQPMAAFFTLIFPLFLLFLFGSIYGNEPSELLGGRGNVDVSVPGYIAMIIATSGLTNLPIILATYREQGILRRYQASPVSTLTILLAQLVVSGLTAVVGGSLLVLVGVLVYDLVLPVAVWGTLLAFILGSLSFLAVGFLLSSILVTSRTATAVGNALLFPMIFLSGAALPRQILPENIQQFGDFLPLTHVVNLIQGLWYGDGWNVGSLVVVLAVMLLAGVVATRTFRWE